MEPFAPGVSPETTDRHGPEERSVGTGESAAEKNGQSAPLSVQPVPVLAALGPWRRFAGLTAGFSTRLGGVSQAPWHSLNTGLHVGDEAGAVIRNRRSIAERLGWPFEAWTSASQVHGNRVYRVTAADRGRGRERPEDAAAEADALITDVPGILLVMYYADCVPVYFYDPDHAAVGLAHAGWRGIALDVVGETVRAMEAAFGSRPERLYAAIGPSIGPCCYEVDEPVLERLLPLGETLRQFGGPGAEALTVPSRPGRAGANLKEFARRLMMKAGILPSRIEISRWCTGCRTDLFFSHRREGGRTGRMAAWLGRRS
ncbi:MAG TPA: peptidoglycan editing factor PgeF [Paenibacillaceae bacterium]